MSALNVVAIYDGLIGGIRVNEALEWLGRSLGPFMRVAHRSWSFASLERLDVRAAAIHEAADADVLIIAADSEEGLPPQVAGWIERCFMENGGGPAALVALHDDDPEHGAASRVLTTVLRKIAGRWHMEFIGNEEFDARMNPEGVHQIFGRGGERLQFRHQGGFEFDAPATSEVWLGALDE